MKESPSQSQDKFIIRLPDGMRDRIKAAAEKSNRSMNAEIIATLEEKYPAPSPPDHSEYILQRSRELFAQMQMTVAAHKDPNQDWAELAARFEELKAEHDKLFTDTSNGKD